MTVLDVATGPDLLRHHEAQRVRELSWWRVRLPLARALHHASVRTSALESVVVRLRTDDAEGWAEVRADGGYATGESWSDISAALGQHPTGGTVGATTAGLIDRSTLAAMAVDVAGWDAYARRAGRPLAGVLANMEGAAPARSVRTHAPVGFGSADEAAELASAAARAGFTRLKVRVGQPDELADVTRLRAAREAAPGAELIVDANGGWTLRQALDVLPALAEVGVTWLEQPSATIADLTALTHEAVRTGSGCRIRADESVRDARSIHLLRGAVQGVHLKLEKVGTVRRLVEAVRAAESRGLAVALGQMDQGRLGCAATVHLAAGLRVDEAELWGWGAIAADAARGLELQDGAVLVPTVPGLGVDVDLAATTVLEAGEARRP